MAGPARKLSQDDPPPAGEDTSLEGQAWEDAWDQEISRRAGEVEGGEVTLGSWDDMVAEIRAKHGWI